MSPNIPKIDTSKLPSQALVGTELGRSIALYDQLGPEEIGSAEHLHRVNQVINDARHSGFSVLGDN